MCERIVSSRLRIPILFAVSICLSLAPEADAGRCGWCRGKPAEFCKSFWVLESSWLIRSTGSNIRDGKAKFLFTAELGHMRNIATSSAVGGTLYASGDDDGSFIGIRGRYRRWLGETAALDISPGILLAGGDNRGQLQFPGFVGSVTLTHGDWLGLTFQYQVIRGTWTSSIWRDEHFVATETLDGTQSSVYLGARFGSYLAIAMPAVLMVIMAIQLADEPIGMGS